jgi:2'-5' RNA ligase
MMGGEMRLFAAIDPPAEAINNLEGAVRRKGHLRWTPSDQWHITTAFYGEVSQAVAEDLAEWLQTVAARARPMSLQVAGAGCFPRCPNAARVLWAGVAGDVDELARLSERCVAAGHRGGIAMERRRFTPHLTLARARVATDFSGPHAELWSYSGPGWTTTSLRLVRSTLGAETRHETIAEWPLGGAFEQLVVDPDDKTVVV